MIFAYREIEPDRDCCVYIEDNAAVGDKHATGPCFWHEFGMTYIRGERVPLSYDQIETVLTEDEYDDALENGFSEELLYKLRTPEAYEFAETIMGQEREEIKYLHDLDDADADYLISNYPGDEACRDRGIVSLVYPGWTELAEDEAWSLGYVNDGNDRYFDYDAFADDLREDDSFIELPSGKVASYNL